MTKERFIWLLNNSVKITTDKYPDSIFYYMDPKIERKIKLNNILGNNKIISLNLNKLDKKYLLFEQDKKNMYLWVDYDNIWNKLKSNIDDKAMDMWDLIDGWLKDDTNWKPYTAGKFIFTKELELKDDTNWKPYTAMEGDTLLSNMLKDDTNWKPYTAYIGPIAQLVRLKDDTNWKPYTANPQYSFYPLLLKDDTNWKPYTPGFTINLYD